MPTSPMQYVGRCGPDYGGWPRLVCSNFAVANLLGFRSIGGLWPNLSLEAMDGADSETNLASHLADADALCQLAACHLDLIRFGAWPAQLSADLASLADELTVASELVLDDFQPSPHPLSDHRALKLSEGARHLEEQFAGRRGGVDV